MGIFRAIATYRQQKRATKETAAFTRSFSEIVKIIYKAPYEIAYGINNKGDIVLSFTNYDDKHVEPVTGKDANALSKSPGLHHIHNHPHEDVPPSASDLSFAAEYKAASCIVVTPISVYIIYPNPHEGWASRDALDEALEKHFSLARVIDTKSNGIFTEFEIESTDPFIEAVTSELGYSYSKQPVTSIISSPG